MTAIFGSIHNGSDKDITVTGFTSSIEADMYQIHGVELNMSNVGELTPTVAALCALADTPSRLTGIAHLRVQQAYRSHARAGVQYQ